MTTTDTTAGTVGADLRAPRLGNVGNHGLGACTHTRDVGTAHRGATLLDVGNVWVTCYGAWRPSRNPRPCT